MDANPTNLFPIVAFAVVAIVLVLIGFGSFFTVNTAERAIVEQFSRFSRVAGPGLCLKLPLIESVHRLDMRVQQLVVKVETKTKDNVFVEIPVSVQYQVLQGRVFDAYYQLAEPEQQIESYVHNVILGHVPKMNLDEAFEHQSDIAVAVKKELDDTMEAFGYAIVKALVTDIVPGDKVKSAMDDINAARREQEAALARGETERIMLVKKAEAESQSKELQGKGIAAQRKAIIDGLSESVEIFQKAVVGATPQDVMALVLLTQYLDTLKEIGSSAHSNTIMLPHSPGALTDLFGQIRNAITTGELAAATNGKT